MVPRHARGTSLVGGSSDATYRLGESMNMNATFADYIVQLGLVAPDDARRISAWAARTRTPIGLIAVSHGLIGGAHIDLVLERQRSSCKRFGAEAVEMDLLTQTQVDVLLQVQQFRQAAEFAEGIALAGIISFEEASSALGAFLQTQQGQEAVAYTDAETG